MYNPDCKGCTLVEYVMLAEMAECYLTLSVHILPNSPVSGNVPIVGLIETCSVLLSSKLDLLITCRAL